MTASSSFFSRRGIGSADVELHLPRRLWERISIATSSGDVDLYGEELDITLLSFKTTSGDVSCHLRTCRELRFNSTSGDLDLYGACTDLHAVSTSGDVDLHGPMRDALIKSVSGDIEADGPVLRFIASTMSGDIHLETAQFPQVMELTSKSGDVEARIPDAGPFSLRYKTVSGEAELRFPFRCEGGLAVYGDGSGPCYSMTTLSGDLNLDRY